MTGGGGSTQTSTTTSGPSPEVMAAYRGLVGAASSQAQAPLQQYSGPMVAGFTPQQQAGFQTIDNAQGIWAPYTNAAAQEFGQATKPLWSGLPHFDTSSLPTTGLNSFNNAQSTLGGLNVQPFTSAAMSPINLPGYDTLSTYFNPYQKEVTDTTRALFNEQNAQRQAQIQGDAASRNAYGGDREAVAQALATQQENLSQAPVLANIQQQGFQQAQQELNTQQQLQLQRQQAERQLALGAGQLTTQADLGKAGAYTALGQGAFGEFNNQQQQQLAADQANAWLASQAAFGMGSLGGQAQSQALSGAQAEIGAGGLQQQLAQEQLNIPYQQFLQTQAYPYQQLGFLAPIVEGTGSLSGGRGATTTPGPSTLGQLAGLGTAGAGLAGLFKGNGGSYDSSGTFTPVGGGAIDFGGGGYSSIAKAGGRIGAAGGGRIGDEPRRHYAAGGYRSIGGAGGLNEYGGAGSGMPRHYAQGGFTGIGTPQVSPLTGHVTPVPGQTSFRPQFASGGMTIPKVEGVGSDVPTIDLSYIPQGAPGGQGNSELSPFQPIVNQTQSSSSGGGGIGGILGPALSIGKFFLGFDQGGAVPRGTFDDGAGVFTDPNNAPKERRITRDPGFDWAFSDEMIDAARNADQVLKPRGHGAPPSSAVFTGSKPPPMVAIPASPWGSNPTWVDDYKGWQGRGENPIITDEPRTSMWNEALGNGWISDRSPPDSYDDGGAVSPYGSLPKVPAINLDYIVAPGPAVKGSGPPKPPPGPPQENPMKDAASIGSLGKSAKSLFGDSSSSSSDTSSSSDSGSADGGRIGYQMGGGMTAGAATNTPLGAAVSFGGAPPTTQQSYQQLLQMPLSRLQEMSVQFPPSTPQGKLVAQALAAKKMTPGSGTADASAAPPPPGGGAGSIGQMPSTGGGTGAAALGTSSLGATPQDYGGTSHLAEGGSADDTPGYVTPDELDPHPIVDHSGDTVRIHYPSEGKVLDLGLPPIRDHEHRAAGGATGDMPVHAFGADPNASFTPGVGAAPFEAANGILLPQLNTTASPTGSLFQGNSPAGFGSRDYQPGGGLGNWMVPLAQYQPPGAGPTGPGGSMVFPTRTAFTPQMGGILSALNKGTTLPPWAGGPDPGAATAAGAAADTGTAAGSSDTTSTTSADDIAAQIARNAANAQGGKRGGRFAEGGDIDPRDYLEPPPKGWRPGQQPISPPPLPPPPTEKKDPPTFAGIGGHIGYDDGGDVSNDPGMEDYTPSDLGTSRKVVAHADIPPAPVDKGAYADIPPALPEPPPPKGVVAHADIPPAPVDKGAHADLPPLPVDKGAHADLPPPPRDKGAYADLPPAPVEPSPSRDIPHVPGSYMAKMDQNTAPETPPPAKDFSSVIEPMAGAASASSIGQPPAPAEAEAPAEVPPPPAIPAAQPAPPVAPKARPAAGQPRGFAYFGDSVANGTRGAMNAPGVTHDGWTPDKVLGAFTGADLAGQTAVISSGITNSTSTPGKWQQDIALVPKQIEAARNAGAKDVVLYGVGEGVKDYRSINERLSEIAAANKARFVGLIGTGAYTDQNGVQRPAGWHPRDYKAMGQYTETQAGTEPTLTPPAGTEQAAEAAPTTSVKRPTLGDIITKGEAQSYNSYNRGVAGDSPEGSATWTDKTVGQVMAAQQHGINAVGKYQVIPSTLSGAVRALNIPLDAKFDEPMQDHIYRDYLMTDKKRPEVQAYITGASDNRNAATTAVGQEWTAAATYPQAVAAGLDAARAEYQKAIQEGKSPQEAWNAALSVGVEGDFQIAGGGGGAPRGGGPGGGGASRDTVIDSGTGTARPPVTPASATGTAGTTQTGLSPQIQKVIDDLEQRSKRGSSIYESPYFPLIAAGLGMMASRSPFPGVAIGEGGLIGIRALEQQQGAIPKNEQERAKADAARLELNMLPLKMQSNIDAASDFTGAMTGSAAPPLGGVSVIPPTASPNTATGTTAANTAPATGGATTAASVQTSSAPSAAATTTTVGGTAQVPSVGQAAFAPAATALAAARDLEKTGASTEEIARAAAHAASQLPRPSDNAPMSPVEAQLRGMMASELKAMNRAAVWASPQQLQGYMERYQKLYLSLPSVKAETTRVEAEAKVGPAIIEAGGVAAARAREENQILRGPGSALVRNGQVIAQSPQPVDSIDPETGAKTRTWAYPAVSGTGQPSGGAVGQPAATSPQAQPIPIAPGAAAPTGVGPAHPGQGVPIELGPGQHEAIVARAKIEQTAREKTLADAEGAQAQQATLARLKEDAPKFVSGSFASYVQEASRYLRLMFPGFDQQVASFEDFTKNANALTRQATREVSPRAAFQELQFIAGGLPNPEMSPKGLQRVIGEYEGLNDYRIAKARAQQEWEMQHGGIGHVEGFESNWQATAPVTPYTFILRRMDPDERTELFSKWQTTPEGREVLQKLKQHNDYALQHGLY